MQIYSLIQIFWATTMIFSAFYILPIQQNLSFMPLSELNFEG